MSRQIANGENISQQMLASKSFHHRDERKNTTHTNESSVGSIKMLLWLFFLPTVSISIIFQHCDTHIYTTTEKKLAANVYILTSNDLFRADLRVFRTGTVVTGVEAIFLLDRVRRVPSKPPPPSSSTSFH